MKKKTIIYILLWLTSSVGCYYLGFYYSNQSNNQSKGIAEIKSALYIYNGQVESISFCGYEKEWKEAKEMAYGYYLKLDTVSIRNYFSNRGIKDNRTICSILLSTLCSYRKFYHRPIYTLSDKHLENLIQQSTQNILDNPQSYR